MNHWHAYSYTGQQRPRDADARNPRSATPPLVVSEWADKPRSLLAGTFTDPRGALDWLEQQLTETPPLPTSLPIAVVLEYARQRLTAHPGDQVTRYYTAGAYVVRDLLRCTGGSRCPDPPSARSPEGVDRTGDDLPGGGAVDGARGQ